MDYPGVFAIGLRYGGLLSLALGTLMAGSLFLSPDVWINDYPPDIRERYGPISEQGRRFRPAVASAFFSAVALCLLLALLELDRTGGGLRFLPAFVCAFTLLMVFNLFDLLVVDWLVFVALQPRLVVLPGTEGMPGYRDYAFHLRGFLIGTALIAAFSLLVAALAVLLSGWLGSGR